MEMRKRRNTGGKIDGICKSDFANNVLSIYKRGQDLKLSRKFFNILLEKFTNKCELPSQKIEKMRTKLAIAGKALRKSLAIFRGEIESRVYSIYCKSINSADLKKKNSFLVFVTNFKHFLRLNQNLMESCVNLYADLFEHVNDFTAGNFYKFLEFYIELNIFNFFLSFSHFFFISFIFLLKTRSNMQRNRSL